ncbi:MAG: putative DNA binding domain-containing protein, partial [Anaerolineae bacterium]|nr:putative DNA binding domain-containing protein [Anaerolineae bacterium]
LQQAESRGLDMIAFTDHNTVAGYRQMMDGITQLKMLKDLKRILPEEESRLKKYLRLLDKIKVLPGFEFTATFGFHILAIFPPEKPVREIEHLLLALNVPSDQLDEGSATIGASADVLAAYHGISQAGGIAIAAHANSSNGVAMRGFSFGGQTKIAYTQDENLAALEVTDLEQGGPRTTARFFSGTKPEYPRRMHCIQGSDAHRLENDSGRNKNLGVGGRATEVLLPELSYSALRDLFRSNDFARTRPRRKVKGEQDYDFIHIAREEGSNIIQEFHESMSARGGNLYAIISDVCAFANTNGGTLYVGVSNDPKGKYVGVNNPKQAIKILEKEISSKISPPLTATVDSHKAGGKEILRILVSKGDDPPYAVDDNKIYVRDEAETSLAVRDEIVGLVQQRPVSSGRHRDEVDHGSGAEKSDSKNKEHKTVRPPRTGVEIASVVERNGMSYFTVKDLRNGTTVKNVTVKSARKLWHYAITAYADLPEDISTAKIEWKGDLGVIRNYKQGKIQRYDLAQKEGSKIRVYYGVTEDGIQGPWLDLLGLKAE